MSYIIYSLESNGVVWYIGQTNNPERRLKQHKGKRLIGEVGSKDIPNEYEIEMRILESCDTKDRFYRERHWFDVLKPLYNKRCPKLYQHEIEAYNLTYHSSAPIS